MALKLVFLLLLWDFTLFVVVASSCKVTCSTDYDRSLNCSCSDCVPTYSLLEVTCRDEDIEVHGSCEVQQPRSWCVMYPEMLELVAAIGTNCTATVRQQGDEKLMEASDSSSWALSDVVKPPPPVEVQVANADGNYNVTWDHGNQIDCLMYRVRVRESKDLSKDPAHSLFVKQQKHVLIDCKKLQPRVNYTVDVQAKMCPWNILLGPWSEWSSTAEWTTRRTSAETQEETEGINRHWWYITLPVLLVLLLLLVYSQKPWWQKKLQRIIYIPKAEEFFKPLDLKYGGNFKEWVKPVFSEYDYLQIDVRAQAMSEKQHDVIQWNNEKQNRGDDDGTNQDGRSLRLLQPRSSQGTAGHSAGHVSIHTVTLSGEEEFEGRGASPNSANTLQSYGDGESFGSFEEERGEERHAGYDLEEPQRGIIPQRENQISGDLSVENLNFQPRAQLIEPERVSLDSFASNEQSEDGYPHVDLDTIDSGFGECSSPGASDSNRAERMDSGLFHEHKSSNSNYVKQWMICSTIHEDSGNSESEVHQTQ